MMQPVSSSFVLCMTAAPRWKTSCAQQFFKPLAVVPLGGASRPRREIVALDGGGEFRRLAKETARLGVLESGEPRRLQIGGGAVGGLDQFLHRLGALCRQADAQMDGGE